MRKCDLITTGLALLLCLVASPTSAVRDPHQSLQGADYVVNSTADTDNGTCDPPDCTLREAINAANDDEGPSNIAFNIPPSDDGYNFLTGVWTIYLESALPALTEEGTGVMGSTQTGNQGDTNPYGPEIVVNGASKYDCFNLQSANNTIEGLAINQCIFGIQIVGSGAHHNNISGNYIGINHEGTAAAANAQHGVTILNGHDNTIGGTTAQERNIISGNQFNGVVIMGSSASGNKVIGNYIGTSADGTGAVSNIWRGIDIWHDAHHNTVGGPTSGERNVISGNQTGVNISSAHHNEVMGNYIGTDVSSAHAVPNAVGVYIGEGAQGNLIRYTNTIAYNTAYGVRVDGPTTTGNTISGNSIHSNGGDGIALTGGANGNLSAPTIISHICVAGGASSGPDLQWEAFSDFDGEGRFFESTGGTYLGSFTFWPADVLFRYPYVTLTVTDGSGNTSEFSGSVPSGCLFRYLPLGMKRY